MQINEEESQITAEAVAPEALLTPENTADPAQAVSETAIPTLSGVKRVQRLRKPRSPEGAKRQGESEKERKNRRRKQKIVEEFPDMPPEENPAVSGDVDYTALFRMFADPEPEGEQAAAAPAPESPDGGLQDRGTEPLHEPEPVENRAHSAAEEPLFAENSPDFRDILREFMLGDQHPIYADMPGIGKKAGGAHSAEDELADLDAAINSVIPKAAAIQKREKRMPEPEPALPPEPVIGADAEQTPPEAVPAAESKSKPRRKLNLNLLSRRKTKTGARAPAPEKKGRSTALKRTFRRKHRGKNSRTKMNCRRAAGSC